MAIRFQCAACSEPIEVDDNWARQFIRCPYCQRTVTAPAESTLPEPDRIPVGKPLRQGDVMAAGGEPSAGEIAMRYPPPAFAVMPSNRPATAAFILSCVMLGLLCLAFIIIMRHAPDLQRMQEHMEKARAAGTSGMTAVMEYMQKQDGPTPGWMVAIGVIEVGLVTALMATAILGVIGLLRPYRRSLAVAALVVSGFVCALLCLGVLNSLA